MRTLEELALSSTWVNPKHSVLSAVHLLRGHETKFIAVLTDTELVGLVSLERALSMPKSARVQTIVQPLTTVLQETDSIRAAAQVFIDQDVTVAAVFRGDEFRGLLSSNMLLQEIGRSWDPLTGLPWSNTLRDWGMQELEAGHEIVIAFIDVDDFGQYNKKYGHIVGDKVLTETAAKLRGLVNDSTDILVRYAGDEFVIGTRLSRGVAEDRFGAIEEIEVVIEEATDPVKFTVGIAGGKRTKEREQAHIASMLDNLINLASRDCMRKKLAVTPVTESVAEEIIEEVEEEMSGEQAIQPILERELDYKIHLVSADEDDPERPVAVTLGIGGQDGTGAAIPSGRPLEDTVAEAAASAIGRIETSSAIQIDNVLISTGSDGEKVVTVVGSCLVEGASCALAGTMRVSRNIYSAVASAVVEGYLVAKESA